MADNNEEENEEQIQQQEEKRRASRIKDRARKASRDIAGKVAKQPKRFAKMIAFAIAHLPLLLTIVIIMDSIRYFNWTLGVDKEYIPPETRGRLSKCFNLIIYV